MNCRICMDSLGSAIYSLAELLEILPNCVELLTNCHLNCRMCPRIQEEVRGSFPCTKTWREIHRHKLLCIDSKKKASCTSGKRKEGHFLSVLFNRRILPRVGAADYREQYGASSRGGALGLMMAALPKRGRRPFGGRLLLPSALSGAGASTALRDD